MKKILFSILGIAALAFLPSCSSDDDNNGAFVEPTISIAISDATATGCAVTYTMNDAVAYYRSTKMTQSEYGALSEAQVIAAVEAVPISYVSSKNVRKLESSSEYVFLAIPYTADGVAGKLATATTSTGVFSVTAEAYLSVDETEGYDKTNAIFIKIKSNGNASSGKIYYTKTSEYNTALATYSTPQAVCEALGQDLEPEGLDAIAAGTDIATSEDMNGNPIEDNTDYTGVVVLYDAARTAYVATVNIKTDEIVLTDEYKQYLGTWTMNATDYGTGAPIAPLTVTISINKKNSSYFVEGLMTPATIANFAGCNDKIVATLEDGNIVLSPGQTTELGYSGFDIKFCILDIITGRFTTSTTIFLTGTLSGNTITFTGKTSGTSQYFGYEFIVTIGTKNYSFDDILPYNITFTK